MEKLQELGVKVVACSDSRGTLFDDNGIDIDSIKEIKEVKRASLVEYLESHPEATYVPVESYPEEGNFIWSIPCDIAMPCATQNELNLYDAENLVRNGVIMVNEGANMPTTPDAIEYLKDKGILFSPAKAANAGGVAVSQLEMAQNASMTRWSFEEVDSRLKEIMRGIFETSYNTSIEFDMEGDLQLGSNISFRR